MNAPAHPLPDNPLLDFSGLPRFDAIAHLLVDRYGVAPGDRVAIDMRNYPEWIEAFAAIVSVGAVAVSLNAWWTGPEIEYGLLDSGARLVFLDRERLDRVGDRLDGLGIRAVVVRADGALPPGCDHLDDVLVPGSPMPEVDIDPGRKVVVVQGLGFVGSAMATACAAATAEDGSAAFTVVGVDVPDELGRARIDSVNAGTFPFETSDEEIGLAIAEARKRGNLIATADERAYSLADVVVVDVAFDIDWRAEPPRLLPGSFEKAIRVIGRNVRPGALVLVETTDLIFAVDSIPAIFAITTDPFIVFTSNVFAILGLRSLYFALSGAIAKFRYLKVSLAAILGLVGLKMLAAEWLKDVIGASFNFYLLGIVALILGVGVLASVIVTRRADRQAEPAK